MNTKKFFCLLLAGIMLLPTLAACDFFTPPSNGTTPTEPDDPTEPVEELPDPLPKDKKYNILFIGNSYTKRYSMPTAIFEPMAKAAGYDVNVTAILNGGHTLAAFADPNDTYGAQVAAALSPENYGKYDYVVIQEQSLRPVIDTEKFYDGARALVEKIRAAGATPVLYNHWGRKTGSPDLTTYNMTNETMTWKLAAVGEAIGEELDMPVAYVGLAFFDIYTNMPNIELYDPDLYHPIYNGSYLAAATIFAKIFGVDPTTVPYAGELTEVAAIVNLPIAAKNAVFNTPEIPEEYKTTTTPPTTDPTVPEPTDPPRTVNITKVPSSDLISCVVEGNYTKEQDLGEEAPYATITGTKGQAASWEYSTTGLTDEQKADIADIGYGISMIGIERMDSHTSTGRPSYIMNICNHRFGSRQPTNYFFDDLMYDADGTPNVNGKYTALITLNFGKMCKFEAAGFLVKNGLLGAADIYVSSDGVNWTIVPTACWDMVNGAAVTKCDKVAEKDSQDGLSITNDGCYLFDMAGTEGMYLRVGIIIGHYYNDVATPNKTVVRDIVVFGEYLPENE